MSSASVETVPSELPKEHKKKKKVHRKKAEAAAGPETAAQLEIPVAVSKSKKKTAAGAGEGTVAGTETMQTGDAAKKTRKKKARRKVASTADGYAAPVAVEGLASVVGVAVAPSVVVDMGHTKKKTAKKTSRRKGSTWKDSGSSKMAFQRPQVLNPVTQKSLLREYFQTGEEGVLKDDSVLTAWLPALTGRVLIALCKDPGDAKHRFVYALLVHDKKPFEEVSQLFEQCLQCDPERQLPSVQETYAHFLERNGRLKEAAKWYEEAFDALYKRQTTAADVNLMTLYAAFASEQQLDTAAKLKDVWKDCALLAPHLALAQGNYGLHLLRTDKEAAKSRIEEAAKSGDEHWVNVLAELE